MRYAVTVTRVIETKGHDSAVTWKFTDPAPYEGDLASRTINIMTSPCFGAEETVTLIDDSEAAVSSLAVLYAQEDRARYDAVLRDLNATIQSRGGL